MNVEEFVRLYNSNIKTLVKNNPTDFTEESLIEALINSIYQLKNLRLDPWATIDKINSILKEYKKPIKTPDGEIDHYIDTVNSDILSSLMLMYSKKEKPYYYAYVRLQQEINCRTALSEDINFLSEQEVEDVIINDIASDKPISLKETLKFKDLLIHENKDKLLEILHALLNNTKRKDFAITIIALEQLGILAKYESKKNLFKALEIEFGNIGTESNFNHYLNPNNRKMILDSEIESVINIIKKI